MFKKIGHPSKGDLLLFTEGELSAAEADRVRKHLTTCQVCRSRELYLERTMAEWVHLYSMVGNRQVLNGAAIRTRIKARLDEAARSAPKPNLERLATIFASQSMIHLCSMLFIATIGTAALYRHARITKSQSEFTSQEVGPLPNNKFTPGSTRPVKLSDICPAQDDDLDPEVAPSLQKVVFQEYGMADRRTNDYQVDYLISPQLGGTDDIHNLWPQPYGSTVWNARVKDALEDRLHQMVCDRQIDLPSAQKDIATDWISAYKTIFNTSKPLEGTLTASAGEIDSVE